MAYNNKLSVILGNRFPGIVWRCRRNRNFLLLMKCRSNCSPDAGERKKETKNRLKSISHEINLHFLLQTVKLRVAKSESGADNDRIKSDSESFWKWNFHWMQRLRFLISHGRQLPSFHRSSRNLCKFMTSNVEKNLKVSLDFLPNWVIWCRAETTATTVSGVGDDRLQNELWKLTPLPIWILFFLRHRNRSLRRKSQFHK